MSKFRNLIAGSSVSLVFVFALAYNFADRNIATIPPDLRSVIALPETLVLLLAWVGKLYQKK
jgi:hypothetical protein